MGMIGGYIETSIVISSDRRLSRDLRASKVKRGQICEVATF